MGLIPNLPLARFAVDRGALMRSNKDWLTELWPLESTRVLYINKNQVPVTTELSLILVHSHTLPVVDVQSALLLGIDSDHAYIAVMLDEHSDVAPLWAVFGVHVISPHPFHFTNGGVFRASIQRRI